MSPDACVDCGVEPDDRHRVFIVQTQQIGKRLVAWKRCARCFIKSGAAARQETP